MSQPRLGRLEKVVLQKCWQSEPQDFTPWLAGEANIALLSEALGIDLEVQETEAGVGLFRADIVCLNTADNSVVLIENQLQKTDHTHLGQIMTYAAGLEAVTVIWIAAKFTEEHRAAVDWFNSISDEDLNFFGIEIEVWKIGDSAPAPKFNIVSKPNDWIRYLKETKFAAGGLTPTEKDRVEYWQSFAGFLEAEGLPWSPPKATKSHWVYWSLGRSFCSIQAAVLFTRRRADVYIVVEGQKGKARFQGLHADRREIEDELGFSLDWQELPGKQMSAIAVHMEADLGDRYSWPKIHAWMLDNLLKMDRVFRPRIKKLDEAGLQPEGT